MGIMGIVDYSGGDNRALVEAADGGDPQAMNELGDVLLEEGDRDGAEKWYRRAVETETGDNDAISNLGFVLHKKGDLDGAETWYRKAAGAGDSNAMFNLGRLAEEKNDLGAAVAWYESAAGAGETNAMYSLGLLLKHKGDLDGAETWYRMAAGAGSTVAMNALGVLLKERGDLDAAKAWYERAAEAGDTTAMFNLGALLKGIGDRKGGEVWLRRAAEDGDSSAMDHVGLLFQEDGDLDSAEVWYRRSAEAGNIYGMDNLGFTLKNKGDLEGAKAWYERALEAGSTYATQGLAELRRKAESDPWLDSITFETFGWQMSQNEDGSRLWRDKDACLAERYFNIPPDFESLDPKYLREFVLETYQLVDAPSFRIDELLLEELQKYVPKEIPEQNSLLEIDVFAVDPAKCIVVTTRHRTHDKVHYASGVVVLFAECFWTLGLEMTEDEPVGEREGAVARRILEGGAVAEVLAGEFDPYDRRWDGLVPLEHDPLSRLRVLATRLRESI